MSSLHTLYRKTLPVLAQQTAESLLDKTLQRTDPSSHINYRFLTTAEKSQRLQRLHHQHRLTLKKLSRLQEKLRDVIDQQAIPVDEDTDGDVRAMMEEEEKIMFDNYPEGSFQLPFLGRAEESSSQERSSWHLLASTDD